MGPRVLALSLVGAASFFREPSLFLEPRFWAEEGAHYYQSAITRSFVAGVLNVAAAAHAPYLNLIPQLSALFAAHCLSMERAPLATTMAWAAVMLTLELVVLFGRAELLDPRPMRLLAAFAPLLAVGSSEVWVNTLGAHYYCDVALLLLCLESSRVSRARRAAGVVLFAVLATVSQTSWLVFPAVVLLAFVNWKQHRAYVIVLVSTILLQAVIHFAFFPPHGRGHPDRRAVPHLFVEKLLAWPLLGQGPAEAYGRWAASLDRAHFVGTATFIAAGVVSLVFAFAAVCRRDVTTRVLLLTWLSAAFGYLILGLDVGRAHLPLFNAGRYAFLPGMLLLLLLGHQLASEDVRRDKWLRLVFGAPLSAALFVGITEFRYPERIADDIRGVRWLEEVAHFRADPGYDHLHIAPAAWTVVVPAQMR